MARVATPSRLEELVAGQAGDLLLRRGAPVQDPSPKQPLVGEQCARTARENSADPLHLHRLVLRQRADAILRGPAWRREIRLQASAPRRRFRVPSRERVRQPENVPPRCRVRPRRAATRPEVRVPHIAGLQLVTAPGRRRHQWHQVKHTPSALDVIGQTDRALDRFRHVGDDSIAPTSDLVAEQPRVPQEPAPDCTFGNSRVVGSVAAEHRRHLDHEPAALVPHLERQW